MMNKDDDVVVYICDTCKREFPTIKSLHGHQRVHTSDKALERQLKKTKTSYSHGEGTSSGVTRDNMPVCRYPVAPNRNTGYGFSSGTPLVTHNLNQPTLSNCLGGVYFGPFKSGGRTRFRRYQQSLLNGRNTRAPIATYYRWLPLNTSNGSSSRVPLPYYRYNNSHYHSLGSANSIGRFSNNNNNNNGRSQGSLSLELSLGPSKSMGGSNNNSSAYPYFIPGGDTRNMNMPVRPHASRFHFHSGNPLDSITRNVALSHPPPTNSMNTLVRPEVSRFHFHGHNPLDSILRNVPLSQPPPTTTNLPDDNNVSGSSLIAKEKDKTVVLDDDEKDKVVTGDHDEVDQQEEVEAKSCGRD